MESTAESLAEHEAELSQLDAVAGNGDHGRVMPEAPARRLPPRNVPSPTAPAPPPHCSSPPTRGATAPAALQVHYGAQDYAPALG